MRKKIRVPEYRAENLKGLQEQREDLVNQMQKVLDDAKAEERAMTEDEENTFNELESKIKAIDATIKAEERARDLALNVTSKEKKDKVVKDLTDAEVRAEEEAQTKAFLAYVSGNAAEVRAGEIQLTQGANGAIVPTHIANKIIEEVRDMVPYLTICDVVSTNGKLSVPVYGEDATNYIHADYVSEGTDLTDNVGKFTTIDLNGYVIGALALVSNKLVNNTDINAVDFIVHRVATAMAEKLEKEFTIGTASKIDGISSATKEVETAAGTAITYDELVSLKHSLKQRFRKNAVWIMHPDTYTALCKLKDNNGQPYFKEDEYKILGCKVYESDSMPTIAAGAKTIIFADPKGYTIKATKTVEITILREKFATKNMLGIMAYGEYDAKVTDGKRIVTLKQKAA